MQYQPGRRAFPLLPVVWAIIIAASGFLLGRLSVRRAAASLPHANDDGIDQPQSALQRAQQLSTSQSSGWRPITEDWDDFAEASGLLASRPPLEPGETGSNYYVTQPRQILSWHPRITLMPNFIDQARAHSIIDAAKARLKASQLALRKEDKRDDKQQVRTSQGAFLSSKNDPTQGKALQWLDEKIAAVTSIPEGHFEAFNVLKYEASQHYDSHHDYFQTSMYGPQKSNRIATMLIYLEAPEEGGETVFPLEGVNGVDNMKNFTFKSCDRGYLYKPRSGDAVLFWSVDTNNTFDQQSLHGGCPVARGEKWVATKWMRDVQHG